MRIDKLIDELKSDETISVALASTFEKGTYYLKILIHKTLIKSFKSVIYINIQHFTRVGASYPSPTLLLF